MRIAMVSHLAQGPAPTGAERSFALLAEALARRGHAVMAGLPGRGYLHRALENASIPVVQVPRTMCWVTGERGPRWPGRWLRRLRFEVAWRLRRRGYHAWASWRPDVVYVNTLVNVGAARAASDLGLPVVWHVREIPEPGAARRFLAREASARARRLVAVSRAVAGWMHEEGLAERTVVVPNGVCVPAMPPEARAARQRLGLPAGAAVLAFVGQVRPHKGVELFLEAALAAAARRPEVRLLVAGPGPPGYVHRLRRRLSDPRVAWLGALEDPSDAYAAADVVVVPSMTPDPFPRSVLEAMASGRCVAASRCGGIPEMVVDGESGVLVPPGDAAALERALSGLLDSPAAVAEMGRQAHRRAARVFALERHLERMEALLQEAAES